MVCHWYGLAVSAEDIRNKAGLPFGAAGFADLQRAAGSLGLGTDCVKVGPEGFAWRVRFPVIVSSSGGKFLVVSDSVRGMLDIEDPALGRYRIPSSAFFTHWVQGETFELLEVTDSNGLAGSRLPLSPGMAEKTTAHQRWTPWHLFTAFLLWMTSILWLRWVELLFSAVAIRLLFQAFLPVVILTVLLGFAGYILLQRWQLELGYRLRHVKLFAPIWDSSEPDTSFGINARLAFGQVVEKRFRYAWNGLLAGPFLLVLIGFLSLKSPLFAAALGGGTLLSIGYYHVTRREWLGKQLVQLSELGNSGRVWLIEIFPRSVSTIGFLLAMVLWSILSWIEGFAPETYLSVFIGIMFWSVSLGLTIAGIRSAALQWWGGVVAERAGGSQVSIQGDIVLRLPASEPGLAEVRIPYGKTTLLLFEEEAMVEVLLRWLSARECISGMTLEVGGNSVGSTERDLFRQQVAEFSSNGQTMLPQRDASVQVAEIHRIDGSAWLEMQNVAGSAWVEGLRSLLESGASYLFVHIGLPAMDPFRQLVLFEQIVAQKGNATLVVASNRSEAAASADWMIFMRHGQIVGQGTPADILGKFSLGDPYA